MAFCLIQILIGQKVCGFFFCLKRYLNYFITGLLIGILLIVLENQNVISDTALSGEITGVVAEVGAGKTEVIKLRSLSVDNRQYDGYALFYGPTEGILPGYRVCIHTKMKAYDIPRNPGQFDLKQYYGCRNIYYSGFYENIEVIDSTDHKLLTAIYRQKSAWINKCRQYLTEEDSGILCAVLLGEKSFLDDKLKEQYQKNGVAHILAISGLHISMLGGTFYRLLKRLGLTFAPAGLLSFVVMIPYCIMIGNAVAALRAVMMLILFIGADIKGRSYDFLSSASLAGILILTENPYYLWDSGFLLSFGAIFAIGCVYPCFKMCGWGQTLWLGISVWLVLLPIQLWFFYETSPFSILLNFVVIPLMPLLVACGFLGLLTPAHMFFRLCHMILSFYQSNLIFPSYITGKPDFVQVFVYVMILCCFCALICRKKYLYSSFCMLIGIFLICISPAKGFQITFLDVGQGDCIVISSPYGHHYMIDGGSTDVSQVGKYRILPYLKSQGIKKLDYVMITHFDEDHYNGILEMLESDYEMEHLVIYQNTDKADSGYQVICTEAKNRRIPVLLFSRNDILKDKELTLQCIFPAKNYSAEKNQQSLVFLLKYQSFSCMLTGDLEKDGEQDFCHLPLEDITMLKVGHHGSKNASNDELLDMIRPEYAVISCGMDNRYGHPHKELIERLNKRKINIYQTPESGAIWIKEIRHRMVIETQISERL